MGTLYSEIKSNQMLAFEERGKSEYPEKNLLEQSRDPHANMTSSLGIEAGPHWREASVLTSVSTLKNILNFK